jgi:RNA polymerase sigma-70 factor (ECF subfamily)
VRNFLRKQKDRGRIYLSDDVLAEVAQVRLELRDMLDARREALLHCLDRLQDHQRTLIEQCYAGKVSIKAIADDLGQPPNVLYMMLKRIRRALYECINRTLAAEGLA